MPVGSRVIRVEAEGYQTWSSAVRVIANQQTPVTATLYREPSRPQPVR
ncbi:MAG: PEGA domain-containing protein [Acidobacteria bacterium]|nr:PEGA domain-containing protein [Acidobacteriota bacterium]